MKLELDGDGQEPGASPLRVTSEDFRVAMRELAGGVSLVTTRLGARRAGCVVSSLSSCAIDPPTLLLTLAKENSTASLLLETGRFGVSIAPANLRATVAAFASAPAGEARFAHGAWREVSPGGQWVMEGALAALECRVEETISRHTHLIVLGRVVAAYSATAIETSPLLYWRRDYRELA